MAGPCVQPTVAPQDRLRTCYLRNPGPPTLAVRAPSSLPLECTQGCLAKKQPDGQDQRPVGRPRESRPGQIDQTCRDDLEMCRKPAWRRAMWDPVAGSEGWALLCASAGVSSIEGSCHISRSLITPFTFIEDYF